MLTLRMSRQIWPMWKQRQYASGTRLGQRTHWTSVLGLIVQLFINHHWNTTSYSPQKMAPRWLYFKVRVVKCRWISSPHPLINPLHYIINLFADFSIYSPTLPTTIRAHPKLGDGRQFFVDGFLNDVVSPMNPPIFTITDSLGREVFKIKLNPHPDIQSITCTSELNSVKQLLYQIMNL